MFDGLVQTEALGWVILHHLLNEVKQLQVILSLGRHVLLMGGKGGKEKDQVGMSLFTLCYELNDSGRNFLVAFFCGSMLKV